MAFRVTLTAKAEGDVAAVLKWILEQRATEAGSRWHAQLMARLSTLEQAPEHCAVAAESDDLGLEVRELLFGRRRYKYRILFRVSGRTVDILRVWHSARDAVTREDIG